MFAWLQSAAAFPQGNFAPSLPRAAFSHSASVGSRPPAHAQYAFASALAIQVAGRLPLLQSHSQAGGLHAPAAIHAPN
jgi:hypothetical protein